VIGFIEGVLVLKQAPMLLINVGGLGYEVEAPLTVFYDLPDTGEKLHLHTHFQVREDAHKLYGFANAFERDTFRSLLKVSGVGPKVALAILSGLSAADFKRCVMDSDIGQLTRVPGIGRKTAERLIIEMRDRIETDTANSAALSGVADHGANATSDAISALVALGYKAQDAGRAVRGVERPDASSEDLIRGALASLSRVKP
jgi:holliday junction DNA helicase RuvA